ncbi:MarR family winged helix-turn-helix transcriptional regulator [Anaerosporobacter sp.]
MASNKNSIMNQKKNSLNQVDMENRIIYEKTEKLDKQSYLFGALFVLANKLQKLGDEFDDRITLKQWGVLRAIAEYEEDGATINMVATYTSSSGQNVKKMALILEKKGYITITTDSKDARYVRMYPTQGAKELFEERKNREMKFFEALYKDMDEGTLDGLYQGMRRWHENILAMEQDGNR